ncbi:hypothetical protein OROHE_026582 [Orobanche hederae]
MIKIPVAYIVVVCLLMTSKAANGVIGMNWGRQSVQRLIPSVVVDLLLQNGIRHARIYSTQPDLLEAFSGSGIHLTVGIHNVFSITNDTLADDWVQKTLPYFGPANIRRVYIGNYVFKYGMNNQTLRDAGINTLRLVQKALNKAGYGDHIKASMPHSARVLKDITKPSEAEFKDEIMEDMNTTLRILLDNNAPFVVDIFPALYVYVHKMDLSFAFSDNKSALVVTDVNGAVYTNVFDFVYDAYVWALEKVGAGDLEVVVGQVGWPTDSYVWGQNASTAERFYKSFLPMVASNKGTPKRPGRPIDTYVHSLTDETQIMTTSEGFSRHWGIYRSNGEPKYKIDLTGQGRDIFPTRAKGIMRMPDRWCMFNGKTHDEEKLTRLINTTCRRADCTCLAPGASCSQLGYELTVSYVFNIDFQSMFQDEDACKFDGLGKVVTENPSTGTCVFPVEVVRGHQKDYYDEASSADEKRMPAWAVFMLLLSILWALLWNEFA